MRDAPLILVVDDDEDFREIISQKLKAIGFLVETAPDAIEGRSKSVALLPDLILLDINMPDTNGTQVILDFKSDPNTKRIPVVFISNIDDPWPGVGGDKYSFAKELGAAGFIDKGKDLDHLGDKLREFLLPH